MNLFENLSHYALGAGSVAAYSAGFNIINKNPITQFHWQFYNNPLAGEVLQRSN